MQPTEAKKGYLPQSPLLDSLRVYLNNKKRLQPIIGLGSIIECVKAGAQNREVLYLCEVCVCRLCKADVRNHIMGSLHRYNYIKVCHPDLVSKWKENLDLSQLAWPLMEIAKTLEEKEGPGDVQLLEVEDSVYQTMAAFNDNDAVALLHVLRNGHVQVEPKSHSEASPRQPEPIQPQRTVLLSPKNTAPSFMQSALINSEGMFNNTSSSLMDNTQMYPDHFVPSESSSSLLDGYTETDPLIGLSQVVECRSEDGDTYCFLCHCCRIRSNNQDIVDHLTSSSHLMNYLMETRPEQVEVMTAEVNNDYPLLQSLAKRVELEEGGGELKVVSAPESLCVHVAGKSYHWCIKMLCDGWTRTNILKRKLAVKGPNVNRETTERDATVPSEYNKGRKMRKKKINTVFKVSLPLTEGPMLLKRTSFSSDTIPVSQTDLPASDLDPVSSPESQSEVYELDNDTTLEKEKNIPVCLYQGGKSCPGDYEYFNQFEHGNGRTEQNLYGENNYNRLHTSHEGSGEMNYKGWQNEVPPTQNKWLLPPGCHAQDWESCYASYGCEEWYQSSSQSNAGGTYDMQRKNTQREWSSDYPPSSLVPMPYQGIPGGHWVMSNPDYRTEAWTYPYQTSNQLPPPCYETYTELSQTYSS
ncbi:uncharacterized protein LKV04_016160 isoform 1-T1 [Tautogolabrus adspersus]